MLVSSCCLAEIGEGTYTDKYPLGRNEYNGNGISYRFPVCMKCTNECDETEVCDYCGEKEATEDVPLGRYCADCL